MVEYRRLTVAITGKKTGNPLLLVFMQFLETAVVIIVNVPAAEMGFHLASYGEIVVMVHLVEEMAESPCQPLFAYIPFLGTFARRVSLWQYARGSSQVGRCDLSYLIAQAVVLVFTVVPKAQCPSVGHIVEVDFFCHTDSCFG